MTELENEYQKLKGRKRELEYQLVDVNNKILEVQTQIAKQGNIIRISDFIVTVDPPRTSSWNRTREGKGVMITHKLTGIFEHCKLFDSQHRNKAEAMTNILYKLKQLGWKDETTN